MFEEEDNEGLTAHMGYRYYRNASVCNPVSSWQSKTSQKNHQGGEDLNQTEGKTCWNKQDTAPDRETPLRAMQASSG